MTPGFVLVVLACTADAPPQQRDCVVVVDEVPSVAECRARLAEIKLTLPAGIALGFPECTRAAPFYAARRAKEVLP